MKIIDQTIECGGCEETIEVHHDIDGAYVDCPWCGNFGYL